MALEKTHLADPKALRAYAHPLRLSLVSLLRREGPQTATQAAAALGESVPGCSFHLRQLAKYGLVERAPGADNRERPWRATTTYTSWDDASEDPEVRAATDQLTSVILGRYFEQAQAWLRHRSAEPRRWRAVTGISDDSMHLTAKELTTIGEQIAAIFEPYQARRTDPRLRPRGSRRVTFVNIVMTSEK
jgi:predicted ArsR family transcriptional regulator